MEMGSAKGACRQIRTLYALGTLGSMTDAQLLALFLTHGGDEAEDAFSALVDRHGPMVLAVCRRMLKNTHDAEDAFQATFFILARRAASLARREKLAGWLHGVAVRTASEARRRSARQHRRERRSIEMSNAKPTPSTDQDDILPILDEELGRLPQRFRAALVACELEGKSRRQAALELGIPEGTLSAHLARGRKLLRERLLRRNVSLGSGPASLVIHPRALATIPERLKLATLKASLEFASGCGSGTSVAVTAASLAERVLKTMVLSKLSGICSLAIVACLAAACLGTTVAPAGVSIDQNRPGPNDLSGRVVDETGRAVVDGTVSAVVGNFDARVTFASAKTDANGRFVFPKIWDQEPVKATPGRLGLYARGPDGRLGWLAKIEKGNAGEEERSIEITVGPVGDVRGRVLTRSGQPIKGAPVTPVFVCRRGESRVADSFALDRDTAAAFRTITGEDGSFVVRNIPRGACIQAAVDEPGGGWLHFFWDTTQPVTLTFEDRTGRLSGRIDPLAAGAYPGQISVSARLSESAGLQPGESYQTLFEKIATVANDGSFQLAALPPGRYDVELKFAQSLPFEAIPVQDVVVGPDAPAEVRITLNRLFTVSGRVVDAATGKGVARVPVHCYRFRGQTYIKDARPAETDSDGEYTIRCAPGVLKILPDALPSKHLVPRLGEASEKHVQSDEAWPDLELVAATGLDGIVVDHNGRPVAGAHVYMIESNHGGPRRQNFRVSTGAGGRFHFDQLDPDEKLSLWARTNIAATDSSVSVRPGEARGGITLTIDPRVSCDVRGMLVDTAGKRMKGATVELWWGRLYNTGVGERIEPTSLESYVTRENGWFVFHGLWRGYNYSIEVLVDGQRQSLKHLLVNPAEDTRDVGKIVVPSAESSLDDARGGSGER
jgi:RNA polymerase sigma factor (sigma-70 family)